MSPFRQLTMPIPWREQISAPSPIACTNPLLSFPATMGFSESHT